MKTFFFSVTHAWSTNVISSKGLRWAGRGMCFSTFLSSERRNLSVKSRRRGFQYGLRNRCHDCENERKSSVECDSFQSSQLHQTPCWEVSWQDLMHCASIICLISDTQKRSSRAVALSGSLSGLEYQFNGDKTWGCWRAFPSYLCWVVDVALSERAGATKKCERMPAACSETSTHGRTGEILCFSLIS